MQQKQSIIFYQSGQRKRTAKIVGLLRAWLRHTYPSHWLARLEHQFIFHGIEFTDFHLAMCLELLEQYVGPSLVVVKPNRTLRKTTNCKHVSYAQGTACTVCYVYDVCKIRTVTPSKLVFFNASRKMFSQSLTRYSNLSRNCSFRLATYCIANAAAQIPSYVYETCT